MMPSFRRESQESKVAGRTGEGVRTLSKSAKKKREETKSRQMDVETERGANKAKSGRVARNERPELGNSTS